MTASDPPADAEQEAGRSIAEQEAGRSVAEQEAGRSVAERLLDLLVYLPAGAVTAALEDVPKTVAKGRARVDQELRNARIVGRLALGVGRRRIEEQLERITAEGRASTGSTSEAGAPSPPGPGRVRGAEKGPREAGREPRQERGTGSQPPPAPPRSAEVDRVIPDYDVLAASQVVRRLDGLGRDELRAVIRHERATRGRHMILDRAQQLLGDETSGTRGSHAGTHGSHGTHGRSHGTDGSRAGGDGSGGDGSRGSA